MSESAIDDSEAFRRLSIAVIAFVASVPAWTQFTGQQVQQLGQWKAEALTLYVPETWVPLRRRVNTLIDMLHTVQCVTVITIERAQAVRRDLAVLSGELEVL